MHISWLGQTCVRLQTKNMDEDVVVMIDAYKPDKGDFPRNFSPQIALFSRGKKDAATVGQAFVLDTLGEIEFKNVMVQGLPGPDGNIIFVLNVEGMNVVHLGAINKKPDAHILDKIGTPDVLFAPVGGTKKYLEPEDALELINALEPRVVVPIGHRSDNEPGILPVQNFIKESGLPSEKAEEKVIIKKKELPQDERKLIVLQKV